MYRLKLLGTVDLQGPEGQRVGSVLSQPKRLALLAVLAMDSPRLVQRDALTGLLWPEMSDERARSALRQSLYYLRRSLGPGVVTGKGEEGIGLAEGAVECDARDLLAAAEDGRCADVLRLHGGELMPAFHLADTPAPFEEWLEGLRRRVERRTLECAWRLADEEVKRGNRLAAATAARRAWELGPWGEAALQKLLQILVSAGDVAGARAAYEEFARRLEVEEQRAPRPSTREILDQARESLEPTEREEGPASAVSGSSGPAPGADPDPGRASRVRSWLGRAAVLAGAGLVAWAVIGDGSVAAPDAAAVMPTQDVRLHLEPVRDLDQDQRNSARAEAATAELASRLAESGSHVMLAGEAAGASGVRLRPILQEVDGRLMISVLILDAASDVVLGRVVEADDPGAGAPEILAGRVATEIRRSVDDVLSWRGLAAQRIHPGALEAVRTASEELRTARNLRRQGALEAATVGYQAVDSLLQRAERLAPDWVEPPARRARLQLDRVWLYLIPPNRDLALAQGTILKGLEQADAALAIEAGPQALEVRGNLLYWASVTASEREAKASYLEAAERTLESVVQLDVDRPAAWNLLSALAERRGDYALAYQRARKAYVTDHAQRVSTEILARLFSTALEVGDDVAAGHWCREARLQLADHWLGPYCDLTRLAWNGPRSHERAEALVREGLQRVPEHAGRALIETRIHLTHAVVLARAGRDEGARAILAAVDPGAQSVDVLDLRAWVRTALGEPGQARQLLAAIGEMDPASVRRVNRSRRFRDLSPYAVVRAEQ